MPQGNSFSEETQNRKKNEKQMFFKDDFLNLGGALRSLPQEVLNCYFVTDLDIYYTRYSEIICSIILCINFNTSIVSPSHLISSYRQFSWTLTIFYSLVCIASRHRAHMRLIFLYYLCILSFKIIPERKYLNHIKAIV